MRRGRLSGTERGPMAKRSEGVITDPAIAATVNPGALLSAHTLVLNRHWLAVGFTQARRAISLVYEEVAKVIAPDTFTLHDFDSWADLSRYAPRQECVASVRIVFRVPEIIILTEYNGTPRASVAFSRRNLCIRDRYACQFCGVKLNSHDLTIDHIVPRSRGGYATWDNCVIACVKCNERKGNRTAEEAHMKLVRQPRRPRWAPSFGIPLKHRKESWEKFISDVYWDIELEP
jgi:5-methylcytosine-specific restriction endonuclease McrA